MTLMPAERLAPRVAEMKRRGRLKVGAIADVVVIDAAHVIDRATYEKPGTPSEGIPFVLVNGVPVVADGKVVEGVLPGRPVRAPVQ